MKDARFTKLRDSIYEVLSKGVSPGELSRAIGSSLGDLTKVLEKQLTHKVDAESRELSMSQLGSSCVRKSWMQKHQPEKAERLEPHVRLKFLYGDVVEWLMLLLLRLSGHKVEGCQDEVDIAGVKGHRDAVVDGHLIDIKSANSRGFVKFRDGNLEKDDPFGYLVQLGAYLHASPDIEDKTHASFLAFDKELGHVVVDTYEFSKDKNWEEDVRKLKSVVDDPDKTPPRLPTRPFQGSGNEQLALACSYCAFKQTCFPDMRTFLYSSGPVYLTKVVREPNVQEIKT